ncbi:MAG: peptidoglycan-binding protein, partial [Pseudomonadota bacterium]
RRGAPAAAPPSSAALFAEAEAAHGVPPEVLLAFWAMETNFGSFMGDFPVIASLATLAHDCRRPEIFRPQLLAAIGLYARGGLDLRETGAWAGEIGHVQMLPGDILKLGVDADGDGRVRMKASAEDALATAAAKLADRGWRRGEPWIVEVTTPEGFDWAQSGFGGERPGADWAALGVAARDAGAAQAGGALPAALLAPQGRKGPKFLVYPNFSEVYLAWNQSLVNTLSAAYLATRIGGAPRFLAGAPDPGLGLDAMKRLQERLQALGHDVGAVDGVLGARTRAAVRAEQARLGVPADGWPTPDLLARL